MLSSATLCFTCTALALFLYFFLSNYKLVQSPAKPYEKRNCADGYLSSLLKRNSYKRNLETRTMKIELRTKRTTLSYDSKNIRQQFERFLHLNRDARVERSSTAEQQSRKVFLPRAIAELPCQSSEPAELPPHNLIYELEAELPYDFLSESVHRNNPVTRNVDTTEILPLDPFGGCHESDAMDVRKKTENVQPHIPPKLTFHPSTEVERWKFTRAALLPSAHKFRDSQTPSSILASESPASAAMTFPLASRSASLAVAAHPVRLSSTMMNDPNIFFPMSSSMVNGQNNILSSPISPITLVPPSFNTIPQRVFSLPMEQYGERTTVPSPISGHFWEDWDILQPQRCPSHEFADRLHGTSKFAKKIARHPKTTPSLQTNSAEMSFSNLPWTNSVSSPTREGFGVIAVAFKRSISSLTSTKSGTEYLKDHQIPKRSVSAPFTCQQEEGTFTVATYTTPALNGVSVYYSTKSTKPALDPDGQRLIQLTNSQRIRQCCSFKAYLPNNCNSRRALVHLNKSMRSDTVKRIGTLVKQVPFSGLLRSGSLEDSSFYQSVKLLQETKNTINHVAKARHRFRGGMMSTSARGSLLRAAYPEIKCDHCQRVFNGNDRKRNLARHRRKVHSLETNTQSERSPHPNKSRRSNRRLSLHRTIAS
jgi:hypothetical protein